MFGSFSDLCILRGRKINETSENKNKEISTKRQWNTNERSRNINEKTTKPQRQIKEKKHQRQLMPFRHPKKPRKLTPQQSQHIGTIAPQCTQVNICLLCFSLFVVDLCYVFSLLVVLCYCLVHDLLLFVIAQFDFVDVCYCLVCFG